MLVKLTPGLKFAFRQVRFIANVKTKKYDIFIVYRALNLLVTLGHYKAYGLFLLACGQWPVALGLWLVACGPWLAARGPWPVARGLWPVASGLWSWLLGICDRVTM